MSTKVRFTKDWGGHKKGDVALLRYKEAQEAFGAQVATVQTDLTPESYQTKESSDGNTQRLRTHKSRRR